MTCETTDSLFKPSQNAKLAEEKKSPTNYKTGPGAAHIICIPGTTKHTEVDLHIDTNVLIPGLKRVKFFSYCSYVMCILCTLFLILAMRYQNVELHMMEQHIMALNQKVELLTVTSDSIRQNVAILQGQVNSLMRKHQSIVRYVGTDYQDTGHLHAMKDVPSPELKTVQGSNFNSINSDVLDTDGSSEDTVKLGNLIENSDYELTFAVPLPLDTSVDPFGPMLNDDIERSDSLQELKLDNISDSSLPQVMDILLSAEDSLSHEDDADEGVRLERAKRSNRRGNQKPSGGRHGRSNNKRKKSGTMNLFAYQDAFSGARIALSVCGLPSI
jgi:hypothetical protein